MNHMPTLVTSSPVVNSPIHYQYSDSTPNAPLFSPVEAHNSHQAANTAAATPSHNHGSTIYPLYTGVPWNDTKFNHNPKPSHNYTQPAPPPIMWREDPSTSTPAFRSSSHYDQNVPSSSSAGVYDPFGARKRPSAETFVSPQQLVLVPRDSDDRRGLPRGPYRARR